MKLSNTTKVIVTIVMLTIIFVLALLQPWNSKPDGSTHDALVGTWTNSGDRINVYVVTDPDTGQQYLMSDHGGITPRIHQGPLLWGYNTLRSELSN